MFNVVFYNMTYIHSFIHLFFSKPLLINIVNIQVYHLLFCLAEEALRYTHNACRIYDLNIVCICVFCIILAKHETVFPMNHNVIITAVRFSVLL